MLPRHESGAGEDTGDGAAAPPPEGEHIAALYRRLRRRAILTAYTVLRDAHEAEDAVHDAFVLAMTRWQSLRDRSLEDGWILRIVRNVAVSRSRRRRKLRPSEMAWPDDDGNAGDPRGGAAPAGVVCLADLPGREPDPAELASLRGTVASLRPELRRVFDLVIEGGASARTIAEAEGVADGCIRQRIYRVRRALDPACDDARGSRRVERRPAKRR